MQGGKRRHDVLLRRPGDGRREMSAGVHGRDKCPLVFEEDALAAFPKPTVAAVRGHCVGGGSQLAAACDLRFASLENTLLGQLNVGAGPVPGGNSMARLSQLAGRDRALEILLVADDLDGPRAEQYGCVNRAIPDDQLNDAVDQIASRLARFDHDAIARTKSSVG